MEISITSLITQSGPIGLLVILTLLIFSLVSWGIVFSKFLLFRKVKFDSEEFLEAFWSSSNLAEANEVAEEFEYSPEARVLISGYGELQKINRVRAEDEAPKESLEMQLATMDNLKRSIRKTELQELNILDSSLSFLATTGSATPFIGLFGTVWGIMTSFHEIGLRGSASLAVVAPGISEALIATAAGLAVAIPAVIFYNFFSNKVALIEGEMHNFSTDLLNLIERDLLSRV